MQVTGPSHDLHSGVDGGVGNEPLMDLMGVVASLLDVCSDVYVWCGVYVTHGESALQPKTGQVLVPGFYDDVLPISDKEAALYEVLCSHSPLL